MLKGKVVMVFVMSVALMLRNSVLAYITDLRNPRNARMALKAIVCFVTRSIGPL